MKKQYELTLLIESDDEDYLSDLLDALQAVAELRVLVYGTYYEDITETEGDNNGETVEDPQ